MGTEFHYHSEQLVGLVPVLHSVQPPLSDSLVNIMVRKGGRFRCPTVPALTNNFKKRHQSLSHQVILLVLLPPNYHPQRLLPHHRNQTRNPESQSQPPLQLGISFITTLEGMTRPTALGSAKRTRTLVPATSVQINESPSVKPVLISPSTSPTAPGSEPGPIEITLQATGLNSPGTGVATEQNPAIHQSLMPPGDGSGSGAGFPDVELDVTPDSPSGDVVREGIKDNGKEVEVESNSNENEQTTNKGPPPVVGLDGVAVSPITPTASQLEPAKELQLVPRVQVNDQVVHDMPHDQIPSSPTTPHASTFTLSSVPREDPPAAISTSVTEGLTPFNAHRPLSMPAINFSTCSNSSHSSRRAPSPLTVCIPGSPTVERPTPIQATYDMESSGGEATDADQGTADACYPTAIQELLSPDQLGDHQQLQVQRASHEAETAIGEPGSVRIVTGLEKPSSNFGATVRKVHEPPRRPTSPSSLSHNRKHLYDGLYLLLLSALVKVLIRNPGFLLVPGSVTSQICCRARFCSRRDWKEMYFQIRRAEQQLTWLRIVILVFL